jgi:hypothetical protein
MIKDYKVWLIFIVGLALRLYGYWSQSMWIDECLFASWIERGVYYQEQILILIGQVLPMNEFGLRIIPVITGSLMILVPSLIFKKKEIVYLTTAFIAFFPLFVFWSRVARPYIPAAFLVALSFTKWNKYFIFNFLSLLCTPFALLGFNFNQLFTKIMKMRYKKIGAAIDYEDDFEFKYSAVYNKLNFILFGFFLVVGIGLFMIRPDSSRDFFNMDFLITAKRLWIIPITSLIFHLGPIGERYGKQ